uniref:NADH dehydrogenase subunit 2 n=1 Tax=Physarum polycephalum TaxID=5791 RepID=Q3SAU1_PHYPO|nr:NADH dehydrogenase subunit 2 [Physarum polycephalum]
MFISFLDTLNTLKLLTISDLLFLTISIIFMILSGSYLTIKGGINFAFSKVYTTAVIYSFIIYILLTFNLSNKSLYYFNDSAMFSSYNFDYIVSKFSNLLYFFMIIFLLVLYAYISNNRIKTTFEYPIIVLLAVLGMVILLRSTDLFIWFLTIELQSFCFYTLAAYRTNRSYLQTEAGLKYFLFGSIASSLYLFGTSILYLYTGSVNFDSIAALSYFPIENQYIFHISLVLILISLFFKLGIAPFHFWLPLVYTYSSSIVTYLFILLPKIPLFYLLYKFTSISLSYIIYLPILLSLFIGTVFAFKATNLKTFLAYSAIANTAFFLAPIMYQSTYSFYAFIFYLFTYSILITIAFLPILFLIKSDNSLAFINLRDMIILKKVNPVLAIFYALMALGFAGVPPLLGFFSKLFILLSALSFSAYLLVAVLLAFSLISSFYYLRLVKMLYFSFYLKNASVISIPAIPAYIITIFSVVSIFFSIYPTYFAILLN